jgi:hypothetical protein
MYLTSNGSKTCLLPTTTKSSTRLGSLCNSILLVTFLFLFINHDYKHTILVNKKKTKKNMRTLYIWMTFTKSVGLECINFKTENHQLITEISYMEIERESLSFIQHKNLENNMQSKI